MVCLYSPDPWQLRRTNAIRNWAYYNGTDNRNWTHKPLLDKTFFKDYMGIPLYMEPKFSDYSCQFNFGVLPPPRSSDSALHEPCLEICPNAYRRKVLNKGTAVQCPKA